MIVEFEKSSKRGNPNAPVSAQSRTQAKSNNRSRWEEKSCTQRIHSTAELCAKKESDMQIRKKVLGRPT
jgi:hypothetical protein